jgi:hypothetical protein
VSRFNGEKAGKKPIYLLLYVHFIMQVWPADNKESRMGPRVSVCRKGKDIFLTIKGEINFESSLELLAVVRQLLNTLRKCAAPEDRVSYCLKTRATIDLEKMAHFQEALTAEPYSPEADGQASPEQASSRGPCQEEAAGARPRPGLFLVKGGAL